jgi:hypothetical protein
MNKESMVYIHNGGLLSHKEEQNDATCREKDVTGDHEVK